MSKYILAIDQGTTGTTVAILDQTGALKARVTHDYPQLYPKPGWVEHNPEEIWRSVTHGIEAALAQGKIMGHEVAAIGITNQRETVLIWDRQSGQPIHNAIVWQCRRTTEYCQKLRKRGLEKTIRDKTGLVIDPYFSASKINWLLTNVQGARARAARGELAVGTIDTFLLWRLSGGQAHATDVSNASRTQLMNLKTADWDAQLLKIFQVPAALLPAIQPSSGEFARTKNLAGLPDGIPITGVAGDQQAALFGQACFQPGLAKCTFGTGSFMLLNTGSKMVRSRAGMLTTVAWQLKKNGPLTYALEGGAFICGAAVQFLRDQLGFIKTSAEIESLAAQVTDSEGVEFVPALTGLGAPYWDPKARGLICGMTRGTKRAHIARATLEAMALQNVDILTAMQKDLGRKLREVRVDGGASANNLLMQLQSDYLGLLINRPRMIETTVAGAAFLAGLGVGLWPDLKTLENVWASDKLFRPHMTSKVRTLRLKAWHQAVERVRLEL
ncbi:MAG: glycerol kinase GlpK [Bdellovibrionales bacterium]